MKCNRTHCIDDPIDPVFTRKELKADGWYGFEKFIVTDELLCYKDQLMGFWNKKSGHLVVCEYNWDLVKILHDRNQKAKDEIKYEKLLRTKHYPGCCE